MIISINKEFRLLFIINVIYLIIVLVYLSVHVLYFFHNGCISQFVVREYICHIYSYGLYPFY